MKYLTRNSGRGSKTWVSKLGSKELEILALIWATEKICGTDTGTKNTKGATGVSVLIPQPAKKIPNPKAKKREKRQDTDPRL